MPGSGYGVGCPRSRKAATRDSRAGRASSSSKLSGRFRRTLAGFAATLALTAGVTAPAASAAGRATPQNYVAKADADPVFRADNRSPDEIFKNWFQPKDSNGNADLQAHVNESPDGMHVSTSRSTEGAIGNWVLCGRLIR
jgi:hypothetical protein